MSPLGPFNYTGRVVVCIDNNFVDVCSDTSYSEYFTSRACNSQSSYILSKISLLLLLQVLSLSLSLSFSLSFSFSLSDYTIIPYNTIYSSADSNLNVVFHYCQNDPRSGGFSSFNCNQTISMGQCTAQPLTVSCTGGNIYAIYTI